MGSFKMRLLLIATSLALVAAAPHSEDRQKWRPAQGRDLSKYKPKLPEVAFGTPTPTAPRTKPFEFKKGNKNFAEECGLENPNGVEDRMVGGHEAAHHEWPWQVALFVDDAWFCGGSLSGIPTASMLTLLLSTCLRRSPSANTSGLPVSHRPQMRMRNMLAN